MEIFYGFNLLSYIEFLEKKVFGLPSDRYLFPLEFCLVHFPIGALRNIAVEARYFPVWFLKFQVEIVAEVNFLEVTGGRLKGLGSAGAHR
jgi:hypothetical protein